MARVLGAAGRVRVPAAPPAHVVMRRPLLVRPRVWGAGLAGGVRSAPFRICGSGEAACPQYPRVLPRKVRDLWVGRLPRSSVW